MTHNSYESRECVFMILSKYSIIFRSRMALAMMVLMEVKNDNCRGVGNDTFVPCDQHQESINSECIWWQQ